MGLPLFTLWPRDQDEDAIKTKMPLSSMWEEGMMSSQATSKLPYVRPELTEKGGVAELTQSGVKDLGLADGYVLAPDTPLKNYS